MLRFGFVFVHPEVNPLLDALLQNLFDAAIFPVATGHFNAAAHRKFAAVPEPVP